MFANFVFIFSCILLKYEQISAHFMKFIAYSTGSSSIVLMGDIDTTDESEPKIIPDLQNRSVISIVLGDYHNGALTATGKLLTWGAYSSGALGLGDPVDLPVGAPGGFATRNAHLRAQSQGRGEPPAVEVPTEVRFDHGRKHPKDRFCFSASAAGWHTGALVIDLEVSNVSRLHYTSSLYFTFSPMHVARRKRIFQQGKDQAAAQDRVHPSTHIYRTAPEDTNHHQLSPFLVSSVSVTQRVVCSAAGVPVRPKDNLRNLWENRLILVAVVQEYLVG